MDGEEEELIDGLTDKDILGLIDGDALAPTP